jgi:glycosyltransferase involved in cell wall biosynthesis
VKPAVILVSACDFPNGLAAASRLRMLGRSFTEIGFRSHCLLQYAPGMVPLGSNTQIAGRVPGVEFSFPIGTVRPPTSRLRMLLYKTWGLWRVARAVANLARRESVRYLLSYGNTGLEDCMYLKLARTIGADFLLELCDLHNVVCSEASRGFQRQKEQLKYWANRFKDRHVVPQVAGLLVISHYLLDRYAKYLPRQRILLTPILGDRDEFEANPPPYGSAKRRLIWLGNFRPFEGLEFLIEALAELDHLGGDFHCDLFAVAKKHASYGRKIQTLVEERHLARRVALHPVVPGSEIRAVLANADIALVPRQVSELNRSNFPTKMVDYLFAGKPIVSSRVGEIPLYCQDGVHIAYPANDTPRAFAAAVLSLMRDPDRAFHLGRGARKLAEAEFDFRQVAPRIGDFLRNLPEPLDRHPA